MTDSAALMQEFLNMGEALIVSGAEIFRVEDTLQRLGAAYGARVNVFAITSNIILSAQFADGTALTLTRRIYRRVGNDFGRVEALNDLSRRCCAEPMTPAQLHDEYIRIVTARPRWLPWYAGCVVGAAGFALFFGGGLAETLVAVAVALLIGAFQQFVERLCGNALIFQFLTALMAGLVIGGWARLWPTLQTDIVMISDIMLLVPGAVITNAVRDMLLGDTVSGILRLIESLFWTGAMVLGFLAAMQLMGV